MFNFKKREDLIIKQIEEYTDWNRQKFPMKAGAEKNLLLRFSDKMGINSVEDINMELIAYFVGEELSEFYMKRALIAIRGFLQYANWAGYKCLSHKLITKEMTTKQRVGRPTNYKRAREVQTLRSRNLSFRQIASLLTKKYSAPVHMTSVHRWSKMELSTDKK